MEKSKLAFVLLLALASSLLFAGTIYTSSGKAANGAPATDSLQCKPAQPVEPGGSIDRLRNIHYMRALCSDAGEDCTSGSDCCTDLLSCVVDEERESQGVCAYAACAPVGGQCQSQYDCCFSGGYVDCRQGFCTQCGQLDSTCGSDSDCCTTWGYLCVAGTRQYSN